MDHIKEALNAFKDECKDFMHFNLEVPEIVYNSEDPEWSLKFYRDYVSKNIPVRIKHGFDSTSALEKWNFVYLIKKLGNKEVMVAVTPNGYADGLARTKRETFDEKSSEKSESDEEEIFVLPEEVKMTIKEFIENIKNPKPNYICYIQKQDSNFTEEYKELFEDVDVDIPWVHTIFGKAPDAVNFWMGDSRAITSMHKDFYENIYCVIDGYKDFILAPPTDLPCFTYKKFRVGKYKNVTTESYEVELQQDEEGVVNTVPWIVNDPLKELDDKIEDQKFQNANLYHVRVEKGDCLYLPSLWFHHVRQSHGCIAVNYWYDMEFDVKYCYYKLLESLTTHINN